MLVVQVGDKNDIGNIQIQDIRFTIDEELSGATILQVNAAGSNPGGVAIHNSLITIGGPRDTQLSCPEETNYRGACVGLYLASSSSSAYINNFGAWVADYASDNSTMSHRIAAKGSIRVAASKGTWLSDLGSVYWWLFDLNYNGASNFFNSLFQSETDQHQGSNAVVYTGAIHCDVCGPEIRLML